MKILITGGAGFISSALIRYIFKKVDWWCLDNFWLYQKILDGSYRLERVGEAR